MQSGIVRCCNDFHPPITVQISCYRRWQDVCEFQRPTLMIEAMIPAIRAQAHDTTISTKKHEQVLSGLYRPCRRTS